MNGWKNCLELPERWTEVRGVVGDRDHQMGALPPRLPRGAERGERKGEVEMEDKRKNLGLWFTKV